MIFFHSNSLCRFHNKNNALFQVRFSRMTRYFTNMTARPPSDSVAQQVANLEQRIKELQKFEATFQSAHDCMVLTDFEGNFIEVNAAFCTVLGYTREALLHMRAIDLKPFVLQTDFKQGFESLKKQGSILLETVYLRKDGSLIPCELSASVVQLENKSIIQVVARDITKRKKMEQILLDKNEQLLSLINATSDIICFKDGDGRWLLANEADLQLFKLQGVDYLGKTDAQLAEYSDFYREAFLACQATDEISWQKKISSRCLEKIPRPDEGVKTYDVIKMPLFHADGRRKGLVVIGRDITEDIRASEEIQKKNKEINDSNIALRVLLDQLQGSQEQQEQQVLENLRRLVFPYIKLLDHTELEEEGREYVHLISTHLHALMDSFCRRLNDPSIGLAPKELLVADMVRQGKSSAAIAKLLNLSLRTVEVYRNIIRNKLKISGKKINLQAYLKEKFS